MDDNSDTLCPNESQRKEIKETISPCRYSLLPLVSYKQISNPKEWFGILSFGGI
jgi:hypothetical protein